MEECNDPLNHCVSMVCQVDRRHGNCTMTVGLATAGSAARSRLRDPGAKPAMAYKETFWMACDSTEQLRAEYGPFHTRTEAKFKPKSWDSGICCVTSTCSG